MSANKGVKALYVASTLDTLEDNIYKKMEVLGRLSAKTCCSHADMIYITAGEAMRSGDEERAYVFFMKYMEILKIVRRKPEYKKDEKFFSSLIGLKKFEQALCNCERLQKSLAARYTLKQEEQEAKQLIERQEKLEKHKPEPEPSSSSKGGGGSGSESRRPSRSTPDPAVPPTDDYITCPALQALIRQESTSYLVVDARPAADFAASRLHCRYLVSVPAELLRPGVTAPALEAQLPDDSRQLFARRRTVDQLVVLDWTGDAEAAAGPLDTLRDAMTKWDMTAYRARPLTLAGGYRMWLNTFPMLTTNPQVAAPTAAAARPVDVSLTFQYPSLEEPAPQVDRGVKPAEPDPSRAAPAPIDLDVATERADALLRRIADLRVDGATIAPASAAGERGAAPSDAGERGPAPTVAGVRGPAPSSIGARGPGLSVAGARGPRPSVAGARGPVPSSAGARGMTPAPSGVAKDRPGVPSRALKPTFMDEAAAKRRVDLTRSQLEAEREWQEVRRSRERQTETEMRAELQRKEETLLAEIQRMETEQSNWEAQQDQLRAQNEALRLRLATYESEQTPVPANNSAEKLDSERRIRELEAEQGRVTALVENARLHREQEQEQEQRRAERQEAERARAEKQRLEALDEARRKQADDEARQKRLQDEEAQRQRLEQEARRKKEDEAARRKSEEARKQREEEERQRLEEQERRAAAADRQQDQVYHTRLRDSASAAGGGGLRRSHSSPFIARLGDDQPAPPASTPSFSRETKPFVRNRRGDVQAARTRRFAPAYGSVGAALTGLKNLGNTCYMNAIVQCVNNTPSLNDFFVHEAYQDFINYDSELSHGEAAQELAAAIKVLWSGLYRSVALYDLKDVMGRHHNRFRGTSQQDAHEFLMYLLNFLHEDLNEVKRKRPLKEQENDGVPDQRAAQVAWEDFKSNNRSFIMNLFWGQMKSTLRCSRCGNQSIKWETFSHLSVPMPKRSSKCSLHECIRLYMAGEVIKGWRCPRCHSSIEATKTLDLWHLPPILVIHLQRFYNDGLWRKRQSNVDFPLESLDVSPYVINSKARYRNSKYHLYGVVNHFGSMESGHYTAYCKALASGRWHKFDDHEVYPMDNGAVHTAAGYILFYAAIDSKM